jgi:hypothetical protein
MSPTLFRKGSNGWPLRRAIAAGRNVGKIVAGGRIQVNARGEFEVGEMVAGGKPQAPPPPVGSAFFAVFRELMLHMLHRGPVCNMAVPHEDWGYRVGRSQRDRFNSMPDTADRGWLSGLLSVTPIERMSGCTCLARDDTHILNGYFML